MTLTTSDIISLVGLILVPLGLALFGLRHEQMMRHRENIEKFRMIIGDRMYHRPHSHVEVTPSENGTTTVHQPGALQAENIRFTPLKMNGESKKST